MAYYEGIIQNTEFFTTTELAKKLKMNVQVITRKVQAGEINAYKIGKDWRIPEESVYNWLEDLSNKSGHVNKTEIKPNIIPTLVEPTVPLPHSNRKYLLEYILAQFEPDRSYTENDVNRIIARFHKDFNTFGANSYRNR